MSGSSIMPATINGSEHTAPDHAPLASLVAFYQAFNARDLEALARNWATGEEPSMDNPIGGVRRGWPDIRAGYERLFGGPAHVYVEFHDYTETAGADFHLFVGRERGYCLSNGNRLDLRIRTSRLFARRDGVWRQLHHHGSIEEPHLLETYQCMILGAPVRLAP